MSNLLNQDQGAVGMKTREIKLKPLTDDHWKVVNFLRDYYLNHGEGPMPYEIQKGTGLRLKRLVDLFPCGITVGAYSLARLPQPKDAAPVSS